MKDAEGLMKIRPPPPPIQSNLIRIGTRVPQGEQVVLLPWTFFKHVIIVYYGDGDMWGATNYEIGPWPGATQEAGTFYYNRFLVLTLANRAMRIVGNCNPVAPSPCYTGTLAILYLDW
jgi:hypothetical protein